MGRDAGFDVFLSYSRSDGAAATELNGWLRARGLRTFFDRSELRPGLRWIPALEEAIGRSDAIAILVGRHGIGNTQQYERETALVRQTHDKEFPVIPVLMPGCENPPSGFLQLLTWIDLSQGAGVLQQQDSLEALRGAIQRKPVPASLIRSEICPYRGLEPFLEADAAFFCGRDAAIRELVAQVHAHSFVAVVGRSGSGKSSLVLAGLLPALRQQRQTTMWDVVSCRPGASPLRALAAAFGTVAENAGPAAIDAFLENEAAAYRKGDIGTLVRIVNDRLDAAREKPDRLLIYVDQWEELYAMVPATEDAERRKHSDDVEKFIALLVEAASGPRPRASVVLTVRADFYSPLIRHALLSTLLPRQQMNIPPMEPSDLRSAIETPAKKVGLSFAPPALVDQILNDVGTDEGRLPLLQFALKETWEGRQGDRLTAEAYMEVGGVTGAIQRTAERAYAALTPVQQGAARRLFLRLVTPGEGQDDTRARSAIPDDPQQREIVDLFSDRRTRLLVTGYDALQGLAPLEGIDAHGTVEVAHEALIRRWPTLREWVRLNHEKLRARAAIVQAKIDWEEHGRDERYLLPSGIQLERGRALLANPGDVAVDDVCDYVGLSIAKEDHYLAVKREADLANERRIAEAKLQAKLYRSSLIAAGSFIVASFVSLGLFFWAHGTVEVARETLIRMTWREADQAKADVLRQRAKTIALRAEDAFEYEGPAKALLFAMEAQNQGLPDLLENEQVIFDSLKKTLEKRIISEVSILGGMGVAYSPDGKAIVTMDSNSLRFWNPSDGKEIDIYPLDALKIATPFGRIQWSPTGEWLAIGSQDKTLLLAPCSHPRLKALFPSCAEEGQDRQKVMLDPDHRAGLAKFSNDGRWMVTGGYGATLRRWEIAKGDAAAEIGTSLNVTVSFNAFAISPDMKKVVAGWQGSPGAGEIGIFDPDSGELQAILQPPPEDQKDHGSVIALSFNPSDSNMLLASETGGRIFVWDVKHNIPERLTGTTGTAYQVAFSRDGKSIAAASDDGVIRTWKTQDLTNEPNKLRGHRGPVSWVGFRPDGSLASACPTDKTIRIWNQHSPLGEEPQPLSRAIGAPSSEEPLPRDLWLPRNFGPIAASVTSETGRLVVASTEGRLALFDNAKGWRAPIVEWQGPANVTSLTLEHDPDRIVAVSRSGELKSWPFFGDVSALISFARDHIPFNGEGRLTLSAEDRCKIAIPDDSACKPKLILIR
jgi:WD40 repeat protein